MKDTTQFTINSRPHTSSLTRFGVLGLHSDAMRPLCAGALVALVLVRLALALDALEPEL